jgi:hypothetical protein
LHHARPPAEPPLDAQERRRLEVGACWRGVFPAWLDDSALEGAARLDRFEGDASRANDSFRGAQFSTQPPSMGTGPRVAALLDERRAFLERCALLRSSVKGAATPPEGASGRGSRRPRR